MKNKTKDYLDNTKKEFTEANMFEFALDYFERFCKEYAAEGAVDVLKADKFLSKNIKKFVSPPQESIESKCSDCGTQMDSEEAKVFTCCDKCWNKHYNRPQESRVVLQCGICGYVKPEDQPEADLDKDSLKKVVRMVTDDEIEKYFSWGYGGDKGSAIYGAKWMRSEIQKQLNPKQ